MDTEPNGIANPDGDIRRETLATSIGQVAGESGKSNSEIPEAALPASAARPHRAIDPSIIPRIPYVEESDPPDDGRDTTGRAWRNLG